MVRKKMVNSCSADVSADVSKAGAAKPPPPCSLRRRAVATPKVYTVSAGGASARNRRAKDSLSFTKIAARAGASSCCL